MQVVEVAAGLVFREGRVLIAQRLIGSHLGGLWEFPGGKRESEETLVQCLERELMEELGIEVEVGQLVDSITHAYPEKTVQLHFFRCCWVSNDPTALGCAAFKWVRAAELVESEFPAADARLLASLKSRADWWIP